MVKRISHQSSELTVQVRFLVGAQIERSESCAPKHVWETCAQESKTLRAYFAIF